MADGTPTTLYGRIVLRATIEVLTGLQPNEKIVAGTYQAIRELKDGTLVRATPTDTSNKAKQVAKS